MDTVKALLVAMLLAPIAAFAQQPGTISTMPYASVPFNGSELMYMVQAGVSKKTSVATLGSALSQTFLQSGTGAVTTNFYSPLLNKTFTPEQFGAVADGQTVTDTVSIGANSGVFTTASAHFAVTDVGKLFAVNGAGPSARNAQLVSGGSGYTNGVFTAVVQGGTCTTQPTMLIGIAGGAVALMAELTNPGQCTAQPANPVSISISGNSGTGATFNLTWNPLATTITGFTSATSVTLGANAATTLSASSQRFIWGTDNKTAFQNALTAANSAAASYGAATLQFCGAYAIGSAVAVTTAGHLSVTGACPDSSLYYVSSASFRGLSISGSGTSTASTTLASSASQGAQTISVTSATGFSVGDYIAINGTTPVLAATFGELNRIVGISGTTLTLQMPLSTDYSTSLTTSVANYALAPGIAMNGFAVNGAFQSGSNIGCAWVEYGVDVQVHVRSLECGSYNSEGFVAAFIYGGWIEDLDTGSGNSGNTDAIFLQYVSNTIQNVAVDNGGGFGINWDQNARNEIHARINTAEGRACKTYGSSGNWGFLSCSNTPPGQGYTAIDIESGSSYNHFSYVYAAGAAASNYGNGECLEANGDGSINNTIDHLSVANCPSYTIAIITPDTGWTIGKVDYGANSSAGGNLITAANTVIWPNTAITGTGALSSGSTTTGFTVGSGTAFASGLSIPSPIVGSVIGGSLAGSSLGLVSTSNGSPSGDSVYVQTGGVTRATWLSGGNLGLGTETNPQAPFVFSKNAATGITPISGSEAMFVAADGSGTTVDIDSYVSSGPSPGLAFRGARGTAASPAGIQAGDIEGYFVSRGYNSVGAFNANSTLIQFTAAETLSGTANGSYILFGTTKPATLTRTNVLKLDGYAHLGYTLAAPAPSSCGGGSPAVTSGSTDAAGEVTEGTTATACTITFANAFAAQPFCTVSPEQLSVAFTYSVSVSAISITNTSASGNKYSWVCHGN
jgi:hypothetical protein